MSRSPEIICVGAGIIGLMLAEELSTRGHEVLVVDQSAPGRESSWAGAGMISPAPQSLSIDPDANLRHVSYHRFPELASRLLSETGIDVGYHVTAGIELSTNPDSHVELDVNELQAERIPFENWAASEVVRQLPTLSKNVGAGIFLPTMAQVRNPRLLQALLRSLRKRGVSILENQKVTRLIERDQKIVGIATDLGNEIFAPSTVITAGAWTGHFFPKAVVLAEIKPIRGQIIVYESAGEIVPWIICTGKKYLVPRRDGLVLVGSTEEDVGFEKKTTEAGLEELRTFACELFPELSRCPERYSWAGLRPGSSAGYPVMGKVPAREGLFISAGHFRQGVQLSPGSAVFLADVIEAKPSFAPHDAFSPTRTNHQFTSPFRS